MDQDLIATPVSRLVCSNCAHEMDVAGREAFSRITCEKCGTQLTIPVMLGQFLLVDRMGSGGMGSVYRALDTALNRFVAIKVMRQALGEDSQLVQSFISEAQAAAALNHPNIVQIYSCGTERGQPYIVMELVTGGKLNQMFSRDEPMDEEKLLRIAMDIAEGLKAANEVGLVHGDIKPENILIDQNGTAKIVDFGLAQFVNAQKERGEIWGTPYYISPERARGNKADHRSDIYSLGASMFHVLTGQPPFDGKTAADVVLARLKHPPPDLHVLRPSLQTETVELVNRMMAADPYLRYPNSASLKSDMRGALHAAQQAKKTVKPRHGRGNRASWIVAAAAVALLVFLGIRFVSYIQEEKGKPLPAVTRPATKAPAPAVAQDEKPTEADDIYTVEEVTGPDGKVRLRMTVTFFPPDQEARLVEVGRMLAGEDPLAAYTQLEAFARELPRNSPGILWIPVLEAIPLWAAGDAARAEAGLERVLAYIVRKKEDHPVHMPRLLAAYLLGKAGEEQLREMRREWPAWYGDIVNLVTGIRDLNAGRTGDGWRRLKLYAEGDRGEPGWVYAYREAVSGWNRTLQDWEDVQRRVERQIAAGATGPARQALDRYLRNVPPMFHGAVTPLMEQVAAAEQAQAIREAVAAGQRHRMAVQRDLDRVDQALRDVSVQVMRNRDFRKASLSVSTLPSDMRTDQGRDAAKYLRELIDSLDGLKTFVIKAADVLPYTRADGSDLGGDIVNANTLGVRVSLDGRSISTRGWDSVPPRSMIRMADFYAGQPRFNDRERSDAYLSLAVFCLMNGAFDLARDYSTRALEIRPELDARARRLLPGITAAP